MPTEYVCVSTDDQNLSLLRGDQRHCRSLELAEGNQPSHLTYLQMVAQRLGTVFRAIVLGALQS